MIELLAEKPADISLGQAEMAVNDWLAHHEQVVETQRTDLQVVSGEVGEAPQHFQGRYRFSLSSSKTALLDEAEQALQQYVDWYLLRYHGCSHDGTGGECGWDDTRSWGPVPQEVSG
jgi:hypothetical protein